MITLIQNLTGLTAGLPTITPAATLDIWVREARLLVAKVGVFTNYSVVIEGGPTPNGPWAPLFTFTKANETADFGSATGVLNTSGTSGAAQRVWPHVRARCTVFTPTGSGEVAVNAYAPTEAFDGATPGQGFAPLGATQHAWHDATIYMPQGVPPAGGWGVALRARLTAAYEAQTVLTGNQDFSSVTDILAFLRRGYAVVDYRLTAKNDTIAGGLDGGVFRDSDTPIASTALNPLTMPKAQWDAAFVVQWVRWIAPRYGLNPNRVISLGLTHSTAFPLLAPYKRAPFIGLTSDPRSAFSDLPNALVLVNPNGDFSSVASATANTPFASAATYNSLTPTAATTFGAANPGELLVCSPSVFLGAGATLRRSALLSTPVYITAPSDAAGPAGAISFNSSLVGAVDSATNGYFSALGSSADALKLSSPAACWNALMIRQALRVFGTAAENATKWLNLSFTTNPSTTPQTDLVNSLAASRITDLNLVYIDAINKIEAALGFAPYSGGLGPAISAFVQPIGR